MVKININISNRSFILIGILFVIVIFGGIVIAYNSNPANPAIMGHSVNEIEGAARVESGSFLKPANTVESTVTFSKPFNDVPSIKIYHDIKPGFTNMKGFNDFESTSENDNMNYWGMFIFDVTNTGFKVYTNTGWAWSPINVKWVAIGN